MDREMQRRKTIERNEKGKGTTRGREHYDLFPSTCTKGSTEKTTDRSFADEINGKV